MAMRDNAGFPCLFSRPCFSVLFQPVVVATTSANLLYCDSSYQVLSVIAVLLPAPFQLDRHNLEANRYLGPGYHLVTG